MKTTKSGHHTLKNRIFVSNFGIFAEFLEIWSVVPSVSQLYTPTNALALKMSKFLFVWIVQIHISSQILLKITELDDQTTLT